MVSDARKELEATKDQYEARLRGLRQEHESIKIRYENRIRNITEELQMYKKEFGNVDAGDNNMSSVPVTAGATSSMFSNTTSGVADGQSTTLLENAKKRVHELEMENDRLRQFYTKKLKN